MHIIVLEELRAQPAAVLTALSEFAGVESVWTTHASAREAVARLQPRESEAQQTHPSLGSHPLFRREADAVAALLEQQLALPSAAEYVRMW